MPDLPISAEFENRATTKHGIIAHYFLEMPPAELVKSLQASDIDFKGDRGVIPKVDVGSQKMSIRLLGLGQLSVIIALPASRGARTAFTMTAFAVTATPV